MLCAVAGSLAGFAALAVAASKEPVLPAAFVTLFSPGLRLAEALVAGRHEPLGWTLGWFLRIAIAGNTLFYFVLFTIVDYGLEWLFRKREIR